MVLAQQVTHDELVNLTFDEVRRAAASQPTVCVYLLEAIALLCGVLVGVGLEDRDRALVAQAELIVAGCRTSDLLPADRLRVEEAFADRFGGRPTR